METLSKKLLLLNQTVVDCLGESEEKTIVRKFTEASIRVMQADFGFVWFGGAHSKDFELIYKSPEMPYEPLAPRRDGVSRTVLLESKPMLFEDISKSDFVRESARPFMKSLVVIPMFYKKRSHGSILLCFKEPRHFTEEDHELAHFIGNSAAQALTISHLYAELQDADKKKDNFIAILAHELRNPLSPVLNAIQILQLEAQKSSAVESSTIQEFTEIAEQQVKNMTRILGDLLDVSRIAHGKLQLEKNPMDLVALVQKTAKVIRPKIEKKNHTFHITTPSEPIMVLGDTVRIEQVLVNLLNNATEYMASGGSINLVVEKTERNASVSIRDQGIGMSYETVSKVFDPFFRADSSKERTRDGLGLGLMLSKSIVDMHNGNILAESEGIDRGSTFTIFLPLHSEPAIENEEGKVELVFSNKRKILVVDDNHATADTLSKLLRHHGHEVWTVYDPEAALNHIALEKPQIALLDLGLPSMSGHELGQKLKRHDPTIKLIAISGYGQEEDQRKSQEVGFEHHLVKPVGIEILLQTIENC